MDTNRIKHLIDQLSTYSLEADQELEKINEEIEERSEKEGLEDIQELFIRIHHIERFQRTIDSAVCCLEDLQNDGTCILKQTRDEHKSGLNKFVEESGSGLPIIPSTENE